MKQLTLAEWNESPAYQAALGQFLSSPVGAAMMQVLNNSQPSWPRGVNTNPTDAAIELGRENGFRDCVTLLWMMTSTIPKPKSLGQPDYGTDQPSEEQL